MKKLSNKIIKILEDNDFRADCLEGGVQLETWTKYGVNIVPYFVCETTEEFIQEFSEYVDNFDVDEEIDMHRQNDESYKQAFGIRQSLEDFEDYEERIKNINKAISPK